MSVRIPRQLLAMVQADALSARPSESCGMLFGQPNSIESYQHTANVATNPRSKFEIDPAALIGAEKAMRYGGPRLVGYVHSHPDGRLDPSSTDAQAAFPDGRIWLIVDGVAATLWQSVDDGEVFGRFARLSLEVVD